MRPIPLLVLVLQIAAPTPTRANSADSATPPKASSREFRKVIRPLLDRHCEVCHNDQRHKGGLSLEAYADVKSVREGHEVWTGVLKKLQTGEMPPEGRPQPSKSERDRIIAWLEAELFPVDCKHPDPGRVTLRRLNRAEYNNSIRDLVGLDLHPANAFPADDSGYGFDNIGDVLSLSPLLLEKYLDAAERIVDTVLQGERRPALGDTAGGALRRTAPRILLCWPGLETTNQCARTIVASFARRAFRRPVTPTEVDRLLLPVDRALNEGESFEDSIKRGLVATLVSPHFLFRGELQTNPEDSRTIRPIDEFALASRLSYFLWSSMPDEVLFGLAERGMLRKNLEAQAQRMLADRRAYALVENFAGQWLQTRNLKLVAPDASTFPEFDEELRTAMETETQSFFEHILWYDRSILEFLTADYTFLNERLARHYGIDGVKGADFRQVSLKGTTRGGVLTHASILTLTSNPTRTSPVKRGKWVLENLLASAPPPPPPGVPPLNEAKEEAATASLRQRTERHRADPLCASCHAQMDPIGFSMENFDGIGSWRERDGLFPIDASGQFQTGERFSGAAELRRLLVAERRVQFTRCLAEKMLTYALGRGLEHYDRCALERITRDLAQRGYRFSELVLGVVRSVPFQMYRGDAPEPARAATAPSSR